MLIADADGVYDPADPADRLLLGLRGMMSEAELHVLTARMYQGRMNTARRGEWFSCVPIGYVRSPDGGIALDPDEQVRSVIARVFATFTERGSGTKTHARLVANNIQLGYRVYNGPGKERRVWQRPRRSTLYDILHHPIDAGAYAYGRCPSDPTRRLAGGSGASRRVVPPAEWVCGLKDKVPADIPWDQYERNRATLAANNRGAGHGPRLAGVRRCSTGSSGAAGVAGRWPPGTPGRRLTRGMPVTPSTRNTAGLGARAWSPRTRTGRSRLWSSGRSNRRLGR
ncbi:Transposase [Fimbriiglobus ruber]|uniref:Transposase n=1 Tax=Fimbriiglobus ruber TaxID=1908690 RepID=A0A225DIH4_9BACT|nr:Transposase [Fimbriiglobus ruber]